MQIWKVRLEAENYSLDSGEFKWNLSLFALPVFSRAVTFECDKSNRYSTELQLIFKYHTVLLRTYERSEAREQMLSESFSRDTGWCGTYLGLYSIIAVAQVLQVRGGVGLHRGEVVLQHVNHLRQLRVAPGKLSGNTGGAQTE